jgi:hypothetical protein
MIPGAQGHEAAAVRPIRDAEFLEVGAAGGTRARNPGQERAPKARAFTSFATAASWGVGRLIGPKPLSRPCPDQPR